jgi:hypothetical protein
VCQGREETIHGEGGGHLSREGDHSSRGSRLSGRGVCRETFIKGGGHASREGGSRPSREGGGHAPRQGGGHLLRGRRPSVERDKTEFVEGENHLSVEGGDHLRVEGGRKPSVEREETIRRGDFDFILNVVGRRTMTFCVRKFKNSTCSHDVRVSMDLKRIAARCSPAYSITDQEFETI